MTEKTPLKLRPQCILWTIRHPTSGELICVEQWLSLSPVSSAFVYIRGRFTEGTWYQGSLIIGQWCPALEARYTAVMFRRQINTRALGQSAA